MGFAFKHPVWTFIGALFGIGVVRAGIAEVGYAASTKNAAKPTTTTTTLNNAGVVSK